MLDSQDMLHQSLHPEDIKAAIRKRYGSVKKFQKLKGLPPTSVSDLFRGRPSRRVSEAVEQAVQESMEMETSAKLALAHSLNRGAK